MFLTPDNLHKLTGYKTREKQRVWLKEHGVPHREDGVRLIVAEVHVVQWLSGVELRPSSAPRLDRVT